MSYHPDTPPQRDEGITIFLCGQGSILGDACPECGGWLHRVVRGGFPNRYGARFCDEDCIAECDHQNEQDHLRRRDLLCECEVCTRHGRPNDSEKQEWADYLATLDAAGFPEVSS